MSKLSFKNINIPKDPVVKPAPPVEKRVVEKTPVRKKVQPYVKKSNTKESAVRVPQVLLQNLKNSFPDNHFSNTTLVKLGLISAINDTQIRHNFAKLYLTNSVDNLDPVELVESLRTNTQADSDTQMRNLQDSIDDINDKLDVFYDFTRKQSLDDSQLLVGLQLALSLLLGNNFNLITQLPNNTNELQALLLSETSRSIRLMLDKQGSSVYDTIKSNNFRKG